MQDARTQGAFLPPEMIQEIFLHLTMREYSAVSIVNHTWHDCAKVILRRTRWRDYAHLVRLPDAIISHLSDEWSLRCQLFIAWFMRTRLPRLSIETLEIMRDVFDDGSDWTQEGDPTDRSLIAGCASMLDPNDLDSVSHLPIFEPPYTASVDALITYADTCKTHNLIPLDNIVAFADWWKYETDAIVTKFGARFMAACMRPIEFQMSDDKTKNNIALQYIASNHIPIVLTAEIVNAHVWLIQYYPVMHLVSELEIDEVSDLIIDYQEIHKEHLTYFSRKKVQGLVIALERTMKYLDCAMEKSEHGLRLTRARWLLKMIDGKSWREGPARMAFE